MLRIMKSLVKKWMTLFILILMAGSLAAQSIADIEKQIDSEVKALIGKMTLEEKASQLLNTSPAVERLNIPSYNWWNECLHGVARLGRATVFPQSIGLAAAFDENLMLRISTAISDEARAKYEAAQAIGNNQGRYTGLTFWTPNVNIFRDARWGRGMETYGEDPYLTSRLGVAFVKGLQGEHPFYLKTAACAKHYAVHSGPEGDRHHFDAVPSKRDLYNTYLPAFEALVKEAKVEAVMCAYNRLYGEPCCGSTFLLQKILREKWGFKGHILTDCGAIEDFHTGHHVTDTAAESAAKALKAGVDLNCGSSFEHLLAAAELNLIKESDIDRALFTLYKTRYRLGVMGEIPGHPYKGIGPDVVGCDKHKALAYEAALKSIVMLKNDNVLPLDKNLKEIFVLGPTAGDIDALLGNYYGLPGELTTIVEGITQKVSLGTSLEYRRGFQMDRMNENPIGWAVGQAHGSEVTVAVMGLNTLIEGEEGEALASSTKSDRVDIKLPESQIHYLKKIGENRTKPLIVILTGGSPIAVSEVMELADAVLFVWYPGQEGGLAVADILFGDAAPSGKLPVTFPASVDQIPDYDDYNMNNRTYKYMKEAPLFPFGFGLTYSSVDFSEMKLSHEKIGKKGKVTVSAWVENTGDTDVEDVVQLYASELEPEYDAPQVELKGFQRIRLKAGEKKRISFILKGSQLAHCNDNGKKVLNGGEFKLTLANACPIPRSLELGAAEPVSEVLTVK